jgi:hypothetical protein
MYILYIFGGGFSLLIKGFPIYHHQPPSLLELGDFQNSLAKVLAVEQTKETLGSIVNTVSDTELGIVSALVNPLLHILLVLGKVLGTEAFVPDNEALNLETLCDYLHEVADGVLLGSGRVVLRDHAAADDATPVVHGVDGGLEVLTTNILIVDVNAVGSESGEGIGRLLVLVVEGGVETEVVDDVVLLLVVADGANDLEALVLGNLTNELADSTRGGADEDGLALLGLTNGVKARVGGEARHAESTDEELGIEIVGVVELAGGVGLVLGDDAVLGSILHHDDSVTGLELVVVGLEDGRDGHVGDGLAEGKGGRVRLDAGITHAAALVGVEADVVVLGGDAALGRGLVDVELGRLDGQVLAGDGVSLGHLFEDQSLVLNHFEYGGVCV